MIVKFNHEDKDVELDLETKEGMERLRWFAEHLDDLECLGDDGDFYGAVTENAVPSVILDFVEWLDEQRDKPEFDSVADYVETSYATLDLGQWRDAFEDALELDMIEADDDHYDLGAEAVAIEGGVENLPKELLARYFDFEAYGRDLSYDCSHHNGRWIRYR